MTTDHAPDAADARRSASTSFSRLLVVALATEGNEQPALLAMAHHLARSAASEPTVTARALGLRHTAPYSLAGSLVASLTVPANESEYRRIKELEEALRREAEAFGVTPDLEGIQAPEPELLSVISTLAQVHDAAVIGAVEDRGPLQRTLVEELIFQSGRPVVVVPSGMVPRPLRRIAIGWDGTGRAARAVGDALPLLRQADEAELVTVTGEERSRLRVSGADMARHLAHHGVRVTITELLVGDRGAGATLSDHAVLTRADLLVMGAFAHARWRQMVLGGVTLSMIDRPALPILFSH